MNDTNYGPRPGDLVGWEHAESSLVFEVVKSVGVVADVTVRRVGTERDEYARASHLHPLRPTEVGQRVRTADGRTGRVEGLNSGACLVGPDGPLGLRTNETCSTLVRIADPCSETHAAPDYTWSSTYLGEAKPSAADEALQARAAALGEADARSVEAIGKRIAESLKGGPPLLTRAAPPDMAPPSEPAAYVNGKPIEPDTFEVGPCGRRDHAMRPKGVTCVHVWPCGCAVEPDGIEVGGMVEVEADEPHATSSTYLDRNTGKSVTRYSAPRDVLVYGVGTYAEGWTVDEAMAFWRRRVAAAQVGVDSREETRAEALARLALPNEMLADVRADRAARKRECKRACEKAQWRDRVEKIQPRPSTAKIAEGTWYVVTLDATQEVRAGQAVYMTADGKVRLG